MSHNYSILNLLNLKDENISFNNNFCHEEKVNGINIKIVHDTLLYKTKDLL